MSAEIETEIRAGRRQWYGLAVLLVALMLTVINGTMIAVLMPEIIGDLGMSLLQAEWANAGYTLTFAALLLPAGWLGDRFGRRRILIVGIGIFLVGTLGVGSATSGALLSAARVVRPITLSISYGCSPPPGDLIAMSSRRIACPAGRSRAATSCLPIFTIGVTSLSYTRLTPSPIAARTRFRSRTIF